MKTLKYIFLLAAFATIGLTSCTKEDKVVDETEDPTEVTPETGISNGLIDNISSRSDGSLDLGCFSIDFPFALNIDGEEVQIDNEDDFENALELITEESLVDFSYPFSISYEDGTETTINSGEELGEAFANCIPDNGWGEDLFPAFLLDIEGECIGLVYPVSLVDLQGNVSQVDSEEEFIDILAEADESLFFDFPLTVVNEDEEEIEVLDGNALFDLILDCDQTSTGGGFTPTYGGEIGCYGVEYPFSANMQDGSVVEVNDIDEFFALMFEGNLAGYVYPITLITEDEETFVINSDAELGEALQDCGGDVPPIDIGFYILIEGCSDTGSDCYSVNYPINVIIGGEATVLNSFEEAIAAGSGVSNFVELEYPVSVTIIASGDVVSIDNFEDILEILSDCE